jgi:regulator of sigma E protease
MSTLSTLFHVILLIAVVVTVFNIIIFVHELGHFWAAKWRGLQIDRFQIWFGKAIWKKKINGVQYGLGWLPFGGFVALPQMAPMEALEGEGEEGGPERTALPPIQPLDKIIVALAGPLFSMLLALLAAVLVWQVGKPADFIATTEIGYVLSESPAQKAGLRIGDKITEINGAPVHGFAGSLDSITERIILSRGQQITFTVERSGESQPLRLSSGFETGKSRWFQRRGLRQIGIEPAAAVLIGAVVPNSPAAAAQLVKGDVILTIDGKPLRSLSHFSQYLREQNWKTVHLGIRTAAGGDRGVELTPKRPLMPAGSDPMVGIQWDASGEVDIRIVHPEPIRQVRDSLRMMWITITGVVARDSNIGVDHLSGPVGIAKMLYQLLQMENGWSRILAFMVLFNVNLAVLNMLPFPVLDGGHITLAILEKIFGRPVKARPLEILQTFCALLLISLMLFVTSKDIGNDIGRSSRTRQEVVFPEN